MKAQRGHDGTPLEVLGVAGRPGVIFLSTVGSVALVLAGRAAPVPQASAM